MCEFCENKKTLIYIPTDNHKTEDAVLDIVNRKLIFVTTVKKDVGFGEVTIPQNAFSYKINFCPICGRKLEENNFDIDSEIALRRKTFISKIQEKILEILKSIPEMLNDTKTIMSFFNCESKKEPINVAVSKMGEKIEEGNEVSRY